MARGEKPLHKDAQRCAPYSDGPWCFIYDAAHAARLAELDAHDVLLAFAAGGEADARLARIAEEGLVVACESAQDAIVADVLVGKRLTAGQRKKAEWMDAQRAYLTVPSGRLRIESLNSLSFGPDEPSDAGCEIEVDPGSYDATLHRVAWELMDVERMEDRPELPTLLLELHPVTSKGPKATAAQLTLADARGELGSWLAEGRVEGRVFHGSTRAHAYDASIVHVNLRPAHAEALGLRFADTVEVASGESRIELPHIGYLAIRGAQVYFGRDWYAEHLEGRQGHAEFGLLVGSPPWLLTLTGSGLGPETDVVVSVGDPWCDRIDVTVDAGVEGGSVRGRVVWASGTTVILDFTWEELRKAKIGYSDLLELSVQGRAGRAVVPKAAPRELVEEEKQRYSAAARDQGAPQSGPPLGLEGLTYWNDPETQLLWLRSLVGEEHGLDVEAGEEAVLRLRS